MVQFNRVTQEDRDQAAERNSYRTPVPEGNYPIVIGTVKERSLPDGTCEWNIQMEIQDGHSKGRWLFDTLTWTKKWRWKQILVLEACGFDLEKNCEIRPGDLKGVAATVQVRHATKNDKTYANVRGWDVHERPF